MAAFNFPSGPTEGQQFTPPGGPTYVFQSGVWNAVAAADLTVVGTGTFGYLQVNNTGTAYLRLKDTGQTGNSVGAGLDMVGSNDAARMFLGTDGTTGTCFLTSYTGNLSLTATGGAIKLNQNTDVTGAVTLGSTLGVAGNVTPSVTATHNLGSASLRWATVYTSDLSLKNEVGDWTIVEGEDDLFITNNKRGKAYRFALIEVEDGH
jgi:hypothetical protein